MERSYEQGYERQEGLSSFFTKVYGIMFLGLMVTFGITYGIYQGIVYDNQLAIEIATFVMNFYYVVLIAEVVVVIALNARLMKMSKSMAIAMFLLYSVLNGLTFSIILPYYSNVFLALGMAGITFLVMTVYGLVTKSNLSSIGNFLSVALISLIIATVVNIFLGSSTLDYIICYVGLLLFIALTAYDTNKLKMIYNNSASMDNASLGKIAIIGALQLYLDFINMFMYILRLLNRD